VDIRLKRAYDPAVSSDGYRVLIDRLWPRGVSRERAKLDEWGAEATAEHKASAVVRARAGSLRRVSSALHQGASEPTPAAHRAAAAGPQRHPHSRLLRQGRRAQRRRRPRRDLAPRIAEGWDAGVKIRKALAPDRARESPRQCRQPLQPTPCRCRAGVTLTKDPLPLRNARGGFAAALAHQR